MRIGWEGALTAMTTRYDYNAVRYGTVRWDLEEGLLLPILFPVSSCALFWRFVFYDESSTFYLYFSFTTIRGLGDRIWSKNRGGGFAFFGLVVSCGAY